MKNTSLLGPDGKPLSVSMPDMSRRRFTGLAGTSMLAAPMITTANFGAAQTYDGDSDDVLDVIQQLNMQFPGIGRILVTGIIVMLATGAIFYRDVSQGARQHDENRVATQGILPGLFRPTIAERLQGAQTIGTVHLFGTFLICILSAGVSAQLMRNQLLVTHRQLSWEVGRLSAVNAISGLPPLSDLRLLRIIGTLYLVQQALLMILPPPNYS